MCWCFFVRQKTGNDVRISDWSSNVCASEPTVPRRCRNPELSIAAAPGTMIGTDIIGSGLLDRLAAGRSEKANPDQNIITMGAQRVSRTLTVQRQIEEVALKVEIIARTITQNYRDVGVPALRRPALLNDARHT